MATCHPSDTIEKIAYCHMSNNDMSQMINLMKKAVLLFTFVAVAATGYLAFGQMTDLRERFDNFDRNKDGQISGEELSAAPMLKKLDLDDNGSLTMIEAAKALKNKYSANKTVVTSTAPESGSERRLFNQMDKNKDGKLDSGEVSKKQCSHIFFHWWSVRIGGKATEDGIKCNLHK
jgi:Ca2+-binding EF-hand superfamily protein